MQLFHCRCANPRIYVCRSVFISFCRFDPDRFAPEEAAKREPNSFVPFGFGKRICPGYIFAYIEIATFLAMLLRKYSVTMATTKPVEKVHGLVTCPKEEIFAKLTPREE